MQYYLCNGCGFKNCRETIASIIKFNKMCETCHAKILVKRAKDKKDRLDEEKRKAK